MKRSLVVLLAALLLAAAAPNPSYGPRWEEHPGEQVSLLALIANPKAYEGRKVQTQGFLNLEFENNALYLDREAYSEATLQNAIWVDQPRDMDPRVRKALSRRYVTIEGVLKSGEHGHMGAFSGTLTQVTRISPRLSRVGWAKAMNDDYWSWVVRGDPRFWAMVIFALGVPLGVWVVLSRKRRGVS